MEIEYSNPQLFEKGGPGGPGRPRGRRTLLRTAYVLAELNVSTTDELVKIAQASDTPRNVKVDIWKFLHAFTEAPQTVAQPLVAETPTQSVDRAREIAEKLKELSKPIDAANP